MTAYSCEKDQKIVIMKLIDEIKHEEFFHHQDLMIFPEK